MRCNTGCELRVHVPTIKGKQAPCVEVCCLLNTGRVLEFHLASRLFVEMVGVHPHVWHAALLQAYTNHSFRLVS